MGVVLDLKNLSRTRRYPWDTPPLEETLPDGTPAIDALMPRRVMNEPVAAQPNFTLDAPLTRVFSADPAPATLQPPTPLRRTLSLAPEVEPMPAAELQPLPAEALVAQRRYTRPTFQNTGNEAADLTNYDRSLSQWKDPADRNGRLKSFGLGALRGLMQGLATGQGLGAGLGGAIAGGLHGAITPNADERAWRDEERARTEGQLGTLRERRLEDLKLRGLEAGVEKTVAERDALLNPRPKPVNKQHVVVGEKAYVFDPADGSFTDSGIRGAPKLKAGHDELGDYLYDPENPDKPIVRPKGAELKQFVDAPLSTGGTARVPGVEVYRGDRATEAADATRGNQYSDKTYDDTVRQIDRENAALKEKHASAEKAVNELKAAIRAGQEAAAKVRNPPVHRVGKEVYSAEPEEVARYREEYDKAQQLVNSLGQSIRQNYGEFVDDDPDMKLPILLKAAPAPKAYPSRPAPQRRSVGASPRQGAPKTPPVSEEDFVAHARQALGAAFDESKARTAYRQRYGR